MLGGGRRCGLCLSEMVPERKGIQRPRSSASALELCSQPLDTLRQNSGPGWVRKLPGRAARGAPGGPAPPSQVSGNSGEQVHSTYSKRHPLSFFLKLDL